MKKIGRTAYIWIPALAWMTVIFAFSSRQRVQVSEVYTLNFIFFKTLHLIEYAILYLLFFRSVYLQSGKKNTPAEFYLAIILSIIYAATDEYHQTFISTREGTPRDVLIDTLGIVLMYIYIRNQFPVIKKFIS